MKRIAMTISCALVVATVWYTAPTIAAEWGNLSGTFVYDGDPPAAKMPVLDTDAAYCGKFGVVDESLVVGKDGGLKNVFVYLYLATGEKPPEPHESYAETETAEVVLDNLKCRFDPHALIVRTTQTVVLGNKDTVGHNTKIDPLNNNPINPLIPAGGSLKHQFTETERLPAKVGCNIHKWMGAWILVRDNPYFAVTDEEGKFAIKNLPAGEWTFQVWQEQAGYLQDVKLDGKGTAWRRGRFTVTIEPGDNDLGKILVAPEVFEK